MDLEATKSIPKSSLPGLLREIADAAGVEAACLVAEAKGGCRAYFSHRPLPESWLVKAVGQERASRIGKALAPHIGITLMVPVGNHRTMIRAAAIAKLWKEGASKNEIAAKFGISRRTVDRHKGFPKPVSSRVRASKLERP